MLGKQWLNRYESIDKRGSGIERSRNRQRKLDGIIVWYFDYVMESLPLMLQAGLLLLGCALSRYLWEVNTVVASVVIAVTSLGAIFYISIVIAGSASESCPYQTPGADIFRYIFRHLRHHLLPTLYSASAAIPAVVSSKFSRLFEASACCHVFFRWWSVIGRPWYSTNNIIHSIALFVALFVAPIHDAYHLGRSILRFFVVLSRTVYHQIVGRLGRAHPWVIDTSSLPTLDLDYHAIMLDLRCISWILRTSLDKDLHLSALKLLTSLQQFAHFRSTLPIDCFNIFIGCVSIVNNKVVIIQELEELATASAHGFFRTLHHLATMDPTSGALEDLQRRYNRVFPSGLDFTGLPFYSTMIKIHALAGRFGNPRDIRWPNRRLSAQEYIPFARRMAETAQEKYQQNQGGKVPRWILRSALYLLSLAPLSPAPVVADCLTIVAIDLGFDVSKIAVSDERCVQRNLCLLF